MSTVLRCDFCEHETVVPPYDPNSYSASLVRLGTISVSDSHVLVYSKEVCAKCAKRIVRELEKLKVGN